MRPSNRLRHAAIFVATLVCLLYLAYRALLTLNLTTPYAVFASLLLFAGELYGIATLLLYFLQVWTVRAPRPQPVLEERGVDVLVPSTNEDPLLLRATLQACEAMDYPHKTYVLDDGQREELYDLATELGVHYITRADNKHGKAGSLNHALDQTHGEFVIVLDADHVPEPSFISSLIGYFRDEKLGYVQTPHASTSWQARARFWQVIQPGRNRWNCPIFAGNATMFRRKALEEAGGIAVETSVEDMHTGLRVNAKGWKALAVGDRLTASPTDLDLSTYLAQRQHWGEGNLGALAHDNPLTMRGLTLPQRLCYFGSMIHWTAGIFKLAIYLTPILMLFSGVLPVNEINETLLAVVGVYLAITLGATKLAGNGRASFLRDEFFSILEFYPQIRGTLRALLFRRSQRFVGKRGRPSKKLWPVIRPQVYLLALSGLAIFWGWARPISGISDNFYQPLIPTGWVLFHALLAGAVVWRILRPNDRRLTTRNLVHVPVIYELQNTATAAEMLNFGVTLDLSDAGLTLIAYEPLPYGGVLQLLLRCGGEDISCTGAIRSLADLGEQQSGTQPIHGYRYGIEFRDLSPEAIHSIQRICRDHAVPRLDRNVDAGRKPKRARKNEARPNFGLPIFLSLPDDPERTVCTASEDINQGAAAVLLDAAIPSETQLGFLLLSPFGQITGQATLRREARRARAHQFCVLQFEDFDGEGRELLARISEDGDASQLQPVPMPAPKPMHMPIIRESVLALCVAVPLILTEIMLFHGVYRDDFFLRDVSAERLPANAEQSARADRILTTTLAMRHPSTTRLMLLTSALVKLDHGQETLDSRDVDPPIALDDIELDRTRAAFQQLRKELETQPLPAGQRQDLLLAVGRSAAHVGDVGLAIQCFRAVLQELPDNRGLRDELAGVLIQARRYSEAEALFTAAKPDFDGALLLASAAARQGEYDRAEQACRALMKAHPGQQRAELLLANVLARRKRFEQAQAISERLESGASLPAVQLRLAQIELWCGNHDAALRRFSGLLREPRGGVEVVQGFIAAAANAPHLTDDTRLLALQVADRFLPALAGQPVYLARLAGALQRCREFDKSAQLLEQCLAKQPEDANLRRQYIGVLIAAGREDDAVKMLKQHDDRAAHRFLVDLYLKKHDLAAAEKECRWLIQQQPDDRSAQRLLADVLSWKKDYPSALAQLRQLASATKDDPELLIRLAEVALWSGAYAQALDGYTTLLEKSFDRPALWQGFVDAAAHAPDLQPAHAKLAGRISGQLLGKSAPADLSKQPMFLTRLALVLLRAKQPAGAKKLLERALALAPAAAADRRELAGVLASAGLNEQAIRMYEGLPLERADRFKLVGVYSAQKNFAAAIEQCRDILKQQPKDRQARRLLADILTSTKDYAEALTLLRTLAADAPDDAELSARLAQVALESGDDTGALAHYTGLLDLSFERPGLWPNFVEAAARAAELQSVHARLAARIAQRVTAAEVPNRLDRQPVFLARLAWVLRRVQDSRQADMLFSRSLALNPGAPAERRELAHILLLAGKNKDALRMYEGLSLQTKDRFELALLYASEKDFAAAAKQYRLILEADRANAKTQLLLADVLASDRKYTEATELYEKLRQSDPVNPALPVRLARVALWQGDHDLALIRYRDLLAKDPKQPLLWTEYIDAASSAKKLDRADRPLILDIFTRTAKQPADADYLGRFAAVLRKVDEPRMALLLLRRALGLEPKSQKLRLQLAELLFDLGELDEAEREFKILRRELPPVPPRP